MIRERVDVLVIGGGPAGLAAALAARAEGAGSVLVIEREAALGGILRQCIHTGFGLHRFQAELSGPEYARRDIDRLDGAGVAWRCDTTVLSLSADRVAETISPRDGVHLIEAGSVVLAMGCRERPCGALAIPGTHGAGILSAGTAQRLVNLEGLMPGRRVVILGSGDIGLIMARRLTCEGARVLACVEIMSYSSGLRRNIVQCLDDFGIPLLLSHTVIGIEGHERLTAVTIARVDDCRCPVPGTERRIECDTLLLSVGLIPEIELARQAGIELAPATGGPRVDQSLATSAPGVFACGNVLHVHDLVDAVSTEGESAGREAARFARMRPATRSAALARVLRMAAGSGVGSMVPQVIRLAAERVVASGKAAANGPQAAADDVPRVPIHEPVTVYFRPTGVFSPARITVMAGDRVLLQKRHRILTPGEQASVTLEPDLLARVAADEQLDELRIEVACLSQPDMRQPVALQPVALQPVTYQPDMRKPDMHQPVVAAAVAADLSSAAGPDSSDLQFAAGPDSSDQACVVTCVQCPMGCPITVLTGEDGEPRTSGQQCARGAAYARSEVAAPRRMLTTLVVVPGCRQPMPVRTERPIPKPLFTRALAAIHAAAVSPPVKAGTAVIADLAGTGVAVIATDDRP